MHCLKSTQSEKQIRSIQACQWHWLFRTNPLLALPFQIKFQKVIVLMTVYNYRDKEVVWSL